MAGIEFHCPDVDTLHYRLEVAGGADPQELRVQLLGQVVGHLEAFKAVTARQWRLGEVRFEAPSAGTPGLAAEITLKARQS